MPVRSLLATSRRTAVMPFLALAVLLVALPPVPAAADDQSTSRIALTYTLAAADAALPQGGLLWRRDGRPLAVAAWRWVGPSLMVGTDREGNVAAGWYMLSPSFTSFTEFGRPVAFVESFYETAWVDGDGWARRVGGVRGGPLLGKGVGPEFHCWAFLAGLGVVNGARGDAVATYMELGAEWRRGTVRIACFYHDYGNHARYARALQLRASLLW